jgi:Domain of unknown function (DUF4268)
VPLFELTKESLVQVPETRFDSKVLKTKDLQRLLRHEISVLSPDLKVIAEDFGTWENGGHAIDLLCIDKEGRLVVVDIKRTAEPTYVELQGIRYAAQISSMTFDEAVAVAARDRASETISEQEIRAEILDFLDWTTPEDGEFGASVRIILASAEFSRELTRSVIWLNEQGLDVHCIRLRPHKLADGRVLLDVEQIVPLPEAGAYESSIKKHGQIERLRISDQQQRRLRFLKELWETALKITRVHEDQRPAMQHSSISVRLRPGIAFNYVIRRADSRVEFYAEFNERTEILFHQLNAQRTEIEQTYGRPLHWQERRERKILRVQEIAEGGFLSPEASWPAIQEKLVDAMIRLDRAFRPLLEQSHV